MTTQDRQGVIEDLRQHLNYDPISGRLTWRKRPSPQATGVHIGDEAGCLDGQGYRVFGFRQRQYMAHRVIWALCTGDWPIEVDHRDGNKANNRLSNLRQCDRLLNCQNRVNPIGRSGVRGITWHKRAKKWQVQIKFDGTSRYLGLFSSAKDAAAAYWDAKRGLAGEFAKVAP